MLVCCRVNCVEFWKTGPEDILEQVQWAKEHDQEARRIAQVGVLAWESGEQNVAWARAYSFRSGRLRRSGPWEEH